MIVMASDDTLSQHLEEQSQGYQQHQSYESVDEATGILIAWQEELKV